MVSEPAMFCSQCGTQHPDDANFCMQCGRAFRDEVAGHGVPKMRWEYQDITVPLNVHAVWAGDWEGERKVGERTDKIVLSSLEKLGREGWQPESATDFHSLQVLGRFETRQVLMELRPPKYEVVTIRVKRLVRQV